MLFYNTKERQRSSEDAWQRRAWVRGGDTAAATPAVPSSTRASYQCTCVSVACSNGVAVCASCEAAPELCSRSSSRTTAAARSKPSSRPLVAPTSQVTTFDSAFVQHSTLQAQRGVSAAVDRSLTTRLLSLARSCCSMRVTRVLLASTLVVASLLALLPSSANAAGDVCRALAMSGGGDKAGEW